MCSWVCLPDHRIKCGESARNLECPVHRDTADVGMRQLHDLVHQLLPDAIQLGQVPIMSEGTQGRDPVHGYFTSGADLIVDLMVYSKGLWHAIEIDGRDHASSAAAARDKKKEICLNRWGVPVTVLEWRQRWQLPLTRWRKQLKEGAVYATGASIV